MRLSQATTIATACIFITATSFLLAPAWADNYLLLFLPNLDWTGHRLVIAGIRMFSAGGSRDYHLGEATINGPILAGQPVTINALVKNQNHTGEHFDYVTQVYDQNGVVQYIHVRNSVAVPFGGQIPIDSGPPVLLNDTGTYEVKIFAVIGLSRDSAQLASEPNGRSIEVQ